MSNLEETHKELTERYNELMDRNNELVKTVQFWKITAAQRAKEKLDLLKEISELRLKLSRIRSSSAAQVRQLEIALQAASQDALNHLVNASTAIARTMELTKTYTRDRQELDVSSPRWSNNSGTPATDRVNRVPPLLIGGQSIQPVVSLSRTLFNTNSIRSTNRSPNQQNRNITERSEPIHMLQDVYIPLTRIDAPEQLGNNMEDDSEPSNLNNSTDDLALEDSSEHVLEDSQNLSNIDDFERPGMLGAVHEEVEPEDNEQSVARNSEDNPLEGPSWLLDTHDSQTSRASCRLTLEPDSTTELEEDAAATPPCSTHKVHTRMGLLAPPSLGREFSPTVRRRKRAPSPRAPRTPLSSPRPLRSKNSVSERVLKVVVAKMRFEDDEDLVSPPKRANRDRSGNVSPEVKLSPSPGASVAPSEHSASDEALSRPLEREVSPIVGRPAAKSRSKPQTKNTSPKMMRFDAPSPNGTTDARVIVSETDTVPCQQKAIDGSGEPSGATQQSRGTTPVVADTHDIPREAHVTRRDTSKARRCTANTRHVSETQQDNESRRDTNETQRSSRERASRSESRDSDSGRDPRGTDSSTERQEGRSRRVRKKVTYKEKPLNRKLRR